MRGDHPLIGFTLLMLLLLTNCVQPTEAGGPSVAVAPDTARDLSYDIKMGFHAMIAFFDAVGDVVIQVGRLSRCGLGLLTCLFFPLACLGLWTLSRLNRILGLMSLQDNARSLFGR